MLLNTRTTRSTYLLILRLIVLFILLFHVAECSRMSIFGRKKRPVKCPIEPPPVEYFDEIVQYTPPTDNIENGLACLANALRGGFHIIRVCQRLVYEEDFRIPLPKTFEALLAKPLT